MAGLGAPGVQQYGTVSAGNVATWNSAGYIQDGGAGSSSVVIGTTVITGGTTTRVLYDNAGVVGEYTISGSGSVAMTTSPTFSTSLTVSSGSLVTSGNLSAAAWTTSGVRQKFAAASYTDTSSSGTVAVAYTDLHDVSTILASSATTYTQYYGAFFKAPVASTNVTMTNKSALGADSVSIGGAAQGTAALAVAGSALFSPSAGVSASFVNVAGTGNFSSTDARLQIGTAFSLSNTSGYGATLTNIGGTAAVNLTVLTFTALSGINATTTVNVTAAELSSVGWRGANQVLNLSSTAGIAWTNGTTSGTADLFMGRNGAGRLRHGAPDAATAVAQNIEFQNVVAGNGNVAGANATIIGSLSNGSGASGDIIIQTGGSGIASGSQNTAITALTIKGGTTTTLAGSVVLGSAAIATNATDGFLYIATCAGTPTGVPTAFTGRVAFIYDTTNNKLCVYNGAWKQTAALT